MGQDIDPDSDVTKTMTMEFRRRGDVTRVLLPTIRAIAGADMLRFATIDQNHTITIGRDPSCELVLIDASVSRRHATIRADAEGALTLTDLGSTNGTTHNGKPVTGEVAITVGDHVDAGAVTLRVDQMSMDELNHLKRVGDRLTHANKDPLTGLATRTFIQDDLPGLLQRHRLATVPLSLVFVDVDDFKRCNDVYGHRVGDEVLRATARLMALTVRDSDTCVRYGGEELLVVLPNCDETGAMKMAERLRWEVERHDWSHYAQGLRITISLGVAEDREGMDAAALLEAADRAMYSAKRSGKNRTCRASDAESL